MGTNKPTDYINTKGGASPPLFLFFTPFFRMLSFILFSAQRHLLYSITLPARK